MMHYSRKASLIALASLLYPAAALAGPSDVFAPVSATHDPYQEPLGQLEPNQILSVPNPRAPEPSPPPPPAPDIAITSPSGIEVSDSSPALDRFGTMKPENGGFNERTWEYLDGKEAESLLNTLSAPLPSNVIGDAVIRLLLTDAKPPRDAKPGWLVTRVTALLRTGTVDKAAALLDAVPASLRDPSMDTAYLFAMLLNRQYDPACKTLDRLAQNDKLPMTEPYLRLKVYCAVAGERFDEAELAINMRNEQGTPFDDWFTDLIESLHYDTARMDSFPDAPSGIDLAMLFSTGSQHLPKDFSYAPYLDTSYLSYHPLIASAPRTDRLVQAQFLESVVPLQPGKAAQLGALYVAIAKDKLAPADSPLAKRANAYASLVTAKSSAAAASQLTPTFAAFTGSGRLKAIMLRDPLMALSRTLKPSAAQSGIAAPAFALLTQTGHMQDASFWLKILDRHQPNSATTYVTYEIKRFAEAKDIEKSSSAQQLPPFTLSDTAKPDELRLLQRFYRLMPAFGYHVPDVNASMLDEWVARGAAHPARATVSWPVQDISTYGKRGSAAGVLLTLAAHPAALDTVDDTSLLAAIDALNASGEKALARQLALESLLAMTD